jgi:hypothetical protein
MKKLILIVFTLMIANTTYAAGENASTECVDSDQRSRSAEPIVVNSSTQTDSTETASGSQQ